MQNNYPSQHYDWLKTKMNMNYFNVAYTQL